MICLFLTAATLIAFWQVSQCDFITFDDNVYVTENSHVRNGITMEGIRWAFTTGHAAYWHPLTWISHMLDVQLFGVRPQWHHLSNLVFHLANVLLLFLILYRMTKALWQSAFVAALFALHPLHVESVAWVAERKDVLSTFFWMLSMGAYAYYSERPNLLRYLTVLICFALGLMAKPMLVTLPFVLLLLDYWPLQRVGQKKSTHEVPTEVNRTRAADKRRGKSRTKQATKGLVETEKPADHTYRWALIRPLLWEKLPFFALTLLSSIVIYMAQEKGGAVGSFAAFPPGVRIANAFVSYMAYIGKMIWPSNLALLYPHPGQRPLWQVLSAVLLFVLVTLTVIRNSKRFPYLAVGWLWYVGTLVPVIGIVQVGMQAMADRFTYIPLIGLFIMAAWGIPELLKKWRYRKEVLFASSVLALLCLSAVTWAQVGYWRSSITLFDHTLGVTNRNSIIHTDRGVAYLDLRNYRQAILDFDRAIEIDPSHVNAYLNRGIAYNGLGNHRQAIDDFTKAIEINPNYARAYYNRAIAYNGLRNYRQAVGDFNRAIELDPKFADAYHNRGIAYNGLGNHRQAIEDFDRAIEIEPEYAQAYNDRGGAYYSLGNRRQAIEDFGKAIEIAPRNAEAYNNRGAAYGSLGDYRRAIADFDRAIEIEPGYAQAYYNRGAAYNGLGNRSQVVEDLKKAARFGNEGAQTFLRSQGITW